MSHFSWPLTPVRSSCKSKRFEYDVTLLFIWVQQFSIAIFWLDNFSETRNKNVELCDDRNRDELSKFYPTRNFLILCWNNYCKNRVWLALLTLRVKSKVDGLRSKRTIHEGLTERSKRLTVDGVQKWTVRDEKTGRHKLMKLDNET